MAMGTAVTPARAEAPRVVTSVKPVQGLVAAVMGDVGTPEVLVEGTRSPHGYALTPSDARALAGADLVVWIGPSLSGFLGRALETTAEGVPVLTLIEADGIATMPFASGHHHGHDHGHDDEDAHHGEAHEDGHAHDHDEARAGEAEHDHDHDHGDEHGHDHDHGDTHDHGDDHGHEHGHEEGHAHGAGTDPHIWLDPENARLMLDAIAARLAEIDPANAAVYAGNAGAAKARVSALETELTREIGPFAERGYVVFHDAYRYFERRFGLHSLGAIAIDPEIPPGAERIVALRRSVRESGAACVFMEPQFDPAIVDTVIEGTGARKGVLDPLGSTLAEGPDFYQRLLRAMGDSFRTCLSGG
ncbi:zinc ABC transporter substrate-binding protein [Marivibrio halodurans]|uniref:High-affinity zinc uptake system protein ZnuA n=2 Tax=Marivibrio halodurans TaxID=2039722 RepID=A0A8J7V460_9PROT|nr:zinc ABC transporter substrate-binding protein [Marivibrio halodurans]